MWTQRKSGGKPSWFTSVMLLVSVLLTPPLAGAATRPPEIWMAPTNDVTGHGVDFHEFFLHPERWSRAAASISRFTIPVRYLLKTPPAVVASELHVLHTLGIPLDVAVPALPVDKKVCGNGLEGTVWPGEPLSYATKLKALGVDVYSFSLDLPLTSGTLQKAGQVCNLSASEAAVHTAQATSAILSVYPNAKIIDIEVPTGIPVETWSSNLSEWISAYRRAAGRDFDGFMMDAWWQFDWQSAARATIRVLAPRHIPVGIGIDASGYNTTPDHEWIETAKRNACALRAAGITVSMLGVANWQNMHVRGLPESNPNTLTSLVDWLASDTAC